MTNFTSDYWIVDALPPERIYVAPNTWVDPAHTARVLGARRTLCYQPLATCEDTPP